MDMAQYYYDRGLEREMARDYAGAVTRFKEAIEAGLVNSEIYRRLGICHSELGQYQQAVQAIRKSLEIDSANPLSHYDLGYIYWKLGMRSAAASEYKSALELAPEEIDFYLPLIQIYQQLNRLDEALALVEQALNNDSNDSRVHWLQGNIYSQQGRILDCKNSWLKARKLANDKELKRTYNKALSRLRKEIAPSTLEQRAAAIAALSKIPKSTGQEGNLESRVRELEAICRLDPYFILSWLQLAQAYLDIGRVNDAIATFATIVQQQPENQEALLGWGSALMEQGSYLDASEVFKLVNDINPRTDEGKRARKELILLEVRNRFGAQPVLKFEEAMSRYDAHNRNINVSIELMMEAISLAPNMGLFHYELGWLYLQSTPQRLNLALNHFRLALEADADEGRFYGGFGMALIYNKQYREAVPVLIHAIQLDANDPESRNALATCYIASEELDLAEVEIRKMIELDPYRPVCWQNLYSLLVQQGKFGQAVNELQRLLETVPDAEFAEQAEQILKSTLEIQEGLLQSDNNIPPIPDDSKERLSETTARLCQEGRALEIAGFYDSAIQRYQAAISNDFEAFDPHFLIGNTYTRLGQHQEAIREFRFAASAKATDREIADAHYNIGNSYQVLDDWEQAIFSYRKAIEVYPDIRDAREHLGICFANQGNYEQAIELVRQEMDLQQNAGDSSGAHLNIILGQFYMRVGRSIDALFEFKKGIVARPDLAVLHELAGEILLSEGFWNLAEAECEKALEFQPVSDRAQAMIQGIRFVEYEFPWMSLSSDARVKHSLEYKTKEIQASQRPITERLAGVR